MKKLTILFLFLSSIVFAKPEWNGSYSVITSSNHGTFVHQVEYSNYVSVNSTPIANSVNWNTLASTMTTMTEVFRATSTILNNRVTILENAAPAGGGSVKGSTGCITITGGSFDIPSLNGAINFNDEYDISGTSFCFGITKFHESTINYAIKRIIIPDYADASLPINIYVTWNTTNTAVGFSSSAVVLWNLDVSTTTNSRGHVFTTYGATTSANVSLPYENVDSTITFTNTEIKRNAPIILRLYRTASSAFDNLAAFADVQSCQIYYQRLY